MSVLLSSVIGGSGDFITRSIGSGSVASGAAAGTLFTVTPPTGQRVRLTALTTGDGVLAQVGITVTFGTTDVVSVGNVHGDDPTVGASFSVGNYYPYAPLVATDPPVSNHLWFTGKIDEVLTVTKNTGATNRELFYGYEVGE